MLAEHLRALADAEWFHETLDAIIRERVFAREPIDAPATTAWSKHDRLLLPARPSDPRSSCRGRDGRAARVRPRARLRRPGADRRIAAAE